MAVSKEIEMLINRMDTHPEEFLYEDELDNARHFTTSTGPRWAALLARVYSDACHSSFSEEDARAIKEKHTELVREHVRNSILKQIINGEEPRQEQLDLPYITINAKTTGDIKPSIIYPSTNI